MYNKLPLTQFIGRSVIYLPTCESTNTVAAELLNNEHINEGTVVITSNQTAGRGQRGNTWEAEPNKNLTFSIILKPLFLNAQDQFCLNIALSLAVSDFLKIHLGKAVKIKWPNDIYVDDGNTTRKICGILIQNFIKGEKINQTVAGIGLNVNQQNFGESKAVSLSLLTEKEFDLENLFCTLLERVENRYQAMKDGATAFQKEEYLKNMYWFEEERQFKSKEELFIGTIKGIDEYGRLRIQTELGMRVFAFKEVKFVR